MIWKIEFTLGADREFGKLPRNIQQDIYHYLSKNVISNPRAYGIALKGSGKVKLWRYRVKDYRLVCQIKDQEITVLVIKVGKRDSIYKDSD